MLWRQVVSRSPVSQLEMAGALQSDSAYRQSLQQVNRLLNQGGSLSGHEPNCAFLNTRAGRFADVSAVSGFAFADDARGLAAGDWDRDGNLDVWVSNRTGPRVRFFRNTYKGIHNYAAFRLIGTSCNRDAIGARVSVRMATPQPGVISKSLRAGEGYLSQSSKWLHFGLGTARSMDVQVRWPGGPTQTFRGLEANCRYRLTQGNNAAEVIASGDRPLSIPHQEQQPTVESSAARVVLTSRIPVPVLSFRPFDNSGQVQLAPGSNGPLLVNLWASWCSPCLGELREITERASELDTEGLTIAAISVDGQIPTSHRDRAAEFIRELQFPFLAGSANQEVLVRLQAVHEAPFATEVSMPVPTSLLIDQQGELAVIYRGAIDLDRLLEDVRCLAKGESDRSTRAERFPGRWHERGVPVPPLQIPRGMLDRGFAMDALTYANRFDGQLRAHAEYSKFLVWLADSLVAERPLEAIAQYQRAMAVNSDDTQAMNNCAWHLATHRDSAVRNGPQAVILAERAAKLSEFQDVSVLDTLAASYAEVGRYVDAVRIGQRAQALAADSGQTDLQQRIARRVRIYQRQRPFRAGG